jgi:hypothetical protein
MARRGQLAASIPSDVRARARKAGLDEPDWYAGRLEDPDEVVTGEKPPAPRSQTEIEHSIHEARRRREGHRVAANAGRDNGFVRRILRRASRRLRLAR